MLLSGFGFSLRLKTNKKRNPAGDYLILGLNMHKALVELWADIGSEEYWKDLISECPGVFVPFESRWPQPGFVGTGYLRSPRRIVVMGQNPRAKNTPKAVVADMEMFRLIRQHSRIRSADSLEGLFAMMRNFMLGIDYKPKWRPISVAHRYLGLELDNMAYLNLIPLATHQDKIGPAFKRASHRSTELQLKLLAPHKIVVYGKGAYEKLHEIGLDSWDARYIEQRNYKDAPRVKKWLAS